MITDALQETFSDDQALTATAISTNVMQLNESGIVYGETGQISRNLGAGEHIPLLIQVTEDFSGGTSVKFSLETADDAGLTTNAEILSSSEVIAVADLVAGYRPTFSRVMPDGVLRDFLGMRYTVVGVPTAGKVFAGFAMGVNNG